MINNLFRIAEKAGVVVEYCRLPLNKSASAFDSQGDFILMDYSLIGVNRNEQVHLAHELGHCQTGSFYNPRSPIDIRGRHEERADRWAVRQLVPQQELEAAVACGNTEVWELADYFDVTCAFMEKAILFYKLA